MIQSGSNKIMNIFKKQIFVLERKHSVDSGDKLKNIMNDNIDITFFRSWERKSHNFSNLDKNVLNYILCNE